MSSNKHLPKPRVLLIAADCNPQWHSLPALMAHYYLSLLPVADITLVTQIRNKADLETFVPADAKVVYMDTECIEAPLHKLSTRLTGHSNHAMTGKVAFRYPSQLFFEYKVMRHFKNALRAGEFDIIHRGSPMSPTLPSLIPWMSKTPFVIGPLLGGLPWPKTFQHDMHREGEWLNHLRGLHRFLPFYRSTYKKAAAILAGYQHTVNDLPTDCHHHTIEFSEGGLYTEDYPERQFGNHTQKTILFVGRMVPFKQPEVLVRCFANSPLLQQHKLVMVGDGPELARLQALTQQYQLEDTISFTGNLSFEAVKAWMYKADIFGFPSIREQGGGVLTMASMSSMPSVVVNYGGPATRIPEGCGIRVPVSQADRLTDNVQQALETLVANPATLEAMGKAAREFTKNYYSWTWKAKKTREIYDWVMEKQAKKPDFWEKHSAASPEIGA